MKSGKKALYDVLVGDTILLNMLGLNTPFHNPKGDVSTANSIIPDGKATTNTITPFVTIRGGPRVKIDPLGKIFDEFFYIRCYNDIDKSYYDIDTIIDRIEYLLDGATIVIDSTSTITCTLENVDMEREDEAFNMNYKEARFRLRII